jgi:probable rRNA maturation factor
LAISQTTVDLKFSYKKFLSLKRWLYRVLETENCEAGDITIVFTSDDYLLSVNRKFLKHDYYTDVITFDYSSGKVVGGDILVSIERVKENSGKFDVAFSDELDRVILHGLLHLIGYDDSNELNSEMMRSKENSYLSNRI